MQGKKGTGDRPFLHGALPQTDAAQWWGVYGAVAGVQPGQAGVQMLSIGWKQVRRVRCVAPSALACTLALGVVLPLQAQQKIYRCGNEYTNQPGNAQARNCRVVEGANLTVVEGLRPQPAVPDTAALTPTSTAPRTAAPVAGARTEAEKISSTEQRARDNDARAILTAELRKAEARLQEARAVYNNGQLDKQGDEFRNHQRYLDRVEGLHAQVLRAEADVVGIKRELARLVP